MTVTLGLDPADPLTKRLRDAPARLSNVGPVVEALLRDARDAFRR